MATLTNVISNSTGNVGIGTTSTATKLQVYSTTGTAQIFNQLQLTNMGGGNNGDIVGIGFAAGESTQYGVKGSIGFVRTTSYGRGDITFYTNNTAGTETVSTSNERMRIDSGGNVGIGTTTPFGTTANRTVLSVNGTTDVSLNIGSGGSQRAYLYGVSSYAELGTIGSLPLRFAPNNSEKMRLDANGNLGIGTTSPSAKLDVVNTERMLGILRAQSTTRTTFYDNTFAVNNDGGGANGFIYTSGTGGTFPLDFYGELILQAGPRTGYNNGISLVTGTTSPSVKLRVAEDGKVGIGTTIPNELLEVSGTSPIIRVLAISGSSTLRLTDNGVRNWDLKVVDVNDYFQVGGTTATSLVITGAGNVGIGTTSPATKLDISGSSSTNENLPTTYIRHSFSGTIGYGLSISRNGTDTAALCLGVDSSINAIISSNNADLRIGKTQSSTFNEYIRVNTSGNVGIGFTAPAANLHVFGPTMIVGDSNTTQNVRQTIVGSTTGNASTTAKKIFVCGHTSTGTITVTAIITSVDTASATATFSFANAYGNSVTPNRLSYISLNSTITSIDCNYNNSGYQMEISVTYTGATAPTLYFTAEGMGSSIWTL